MELATAAVPSVTVSSDAVRDPARPTPRTGSGGPGSRGPEWVADSADDREDARQLLTVLLAAVQRERARAEQFYTRARNLLAYTSGLYTLVQAAFFSALGREADGALLITSAERTPIAVAAGVGAIALAVAVLIWLLAADRPKKVTVVGGYSLIDAWFEPDEKDQRLEPLWRLIGKVVDEEETLAAANEDRDVANRRLTWAVGVTATASLVQLVFLYFGLS
jgi:hypothetical protein